MNQNRRAFLDMLAVSEGTSTCPVTRCDGYDVIVMGVDKQWELFRDFSAHPFAPEYSGNGGKKRPSKQINSRGLYSNASGRYQFMLRDWDHYRKQLALPDFGPASQDAWALQLIRERGALPLIDLGNFELAVHRCKNIWASLPGAGYNQPEHPIEKLQLAYVNAGGSLA
jgi:muramidase (phage lysozyme)